MICPESSPSRRLTELGPVFIKFLLAILCVPMIGQKSLPLKTQSFLELNSFDSITTHVSCESERVNVYKVNRSCLGITNTCKLLITKALHACFQQQRFIYSDRLWPTYLFASLPFTSTQQRLNSTNYQTFTAP